MASPGRATCGGSRMRSNVRLRWWRNQIEMLDFTPDIQQASGAPVSPDLILPEECVDFEAYVTRIERELIRRALEKTGGNKGRASRLLNLKRTTLVENLKRLYAHS